MAPRLSVPMGRTEYWAPEIVRQVEFCEGENAALRICMAKGGSDCVRENAMLSACLGRVAPLQKEAAAMRLRFVDWFTANVSDNYTKPRTHRVHDWNHVIAAEKKVWQGRQGGAYGVRRKQVSLTNQYWSEKGFAKRSRLPING